MQEPNLVAGKEYIDFISSVEAIVKRSCIVDFGIVQNVPAKGIVEVSVAVSNTPQNLFYMTCVLANIASASMTVYVEPKVGDRVLVVYPRMYDEDMFTVTGESKEDTKITVNRNATGYNLCSGIAILLNQYKSKGHKNTIKIDDGKVSFANDKCTFDIDENGYLSYKHNTDDDKNTELTFTSSGFTVQDKNGCKIVSSSSDIQINGKLKIKK